MRVFFEPLTSSTILLPCIVYTKSALYVMARIFSPLLFVYASCSSNDTCRCKSCMIPYASCFSRTAARFASFRLSYVMPLYAVFFAPYLLTVCFFNSALYSAGVICVPFVGSVCVFMVWVVCVCHPTLFCVSVGFISRLRICSNYL